MFNSMKHALKSAAAVLMMILAAGCTYPDPAETGHYTDDREKNGDEDAEKTGGKSETDADDRDDAGAGHDSGHENVKSDCLFDYGPATVFSRYPGDGGTSDSKDVYEYDESGLIKSITGFRLDGSDWRPFGRSDYEYDEEGRIEKILSISVKGNNDETEYVYDSSGRISMVFSSDENMEVSFFYDSEDRLVRIEGLDIENSPDGDYEFRYFYDSTGRVIREEYVLMDDNPYVVNREYSYDAEGLPDEKRHTGKCELEEGTSFYHSVTKYEHAPDGRLEFMFTDVVENEEDYIDGMLHPQNRWSMQFNEHGRMQSVFTEEYSLHTEEWSPARETEIEFTDAGSSCTFERQMLVPIRNWIFDLYGYGEVNRYADGR